MVQEHSPLFMFHPLIVQWFQEQVGTPTDVQSRGWPEIAAGGHVLITAPTGSGKTLTAFLWAIHQMVVGAWSKGHTRVLYVSPLKALNNDIQKNLIHPLTRLKAFFQTAGEPFPLIRVSTRSGDTPDSERRAMVRHPPEILITTPESLNLLLSSKMGRTILTGLHTVILDEIHALVGNKRGTHLITAVDRLVLLSGEFQRIALSATLRPVEALTQFIGGYRIEGSGPNPRYVARHVTPILSQTGKTYDIRIRFPEKDPDSFSKGALWEFIVAEIKHLVGINRATLLFVNSRRFCEKLTLKINQDEAQLLAYAHHGSLSREIRQAVEERLKAGELKAIVATSSLELGIDIGELDLVVLFQSPASVSSAIQRVGRAGHGVGEVSRGVLFPTHAQDLLEAAALAPCIPAQDLEAISPVECPLDVLAQVLISMVGLEPWDIDELFLRIKASTPFHRLRRDHFDLILNMLAGRYADTRIRELKPRVSIDRLDNTVVARKGALLALYMSGGTIPDRGYFHLRHHETGELIGELDEEFVWERAPGETFTLGTQHWRIERITHNDVLVHPARPKTRFTPFWKGEEMNRDFHFSSRIGEFLEEIHDRLDSAELSSDLEKFRGLEPAAAKSLIEFLKSQRARTGMDIPHRHHLLVEHIASGPGGVPGNQVVLHTFWGGRVNRPFAMALDAAWKEQYGHGLEIFTANDCIVLQLPDGSQGVDFLSMVTSFRAEELIRKRLEQTGFFGARFRECAGRALLLTRNKISERTPLWMNRLRSQKLLDAVARYDDFPILLEAWRTCLHDEFDLIGLRQVLSEMESGAITWSEVWTSRPSPMAGTVTWRQIDEYMYRGDAPFSEKKSRISRDLVQELLHTPKLRPAVSRAVVTAFEEKRQRLCPGYSPSSARDLLDWIKERVFIPEPEWNLLLQAMLRDHGKESLNWIRDVAQKVLRLCPPQADFSLITSLERAGRVVGSLFGVDSLPIGDSISPEIGPPALPAMKLQNHEDEHLLSLLSEWISFYGPLTSDWIVKTTGMAEDRLTGALSDLIDTGTLIAGLLIMDEPDGICDKDNFGRLLRLARSETIPAFDPLEPDTLPLFMAVMQGIVPLGPKGNETGLEDLQKSIEKTLCYPLPADQWETEFFPARNPDYDPSLMDQIMRPGDLRWIGMERKKVIFCFESDLDLLLNESELGGTFVKFDSVHKDPLFKDPNGRYDFSTLTRVTGLRPADLSRQLWERVWKGRVSNDSFGSIRRGIENRFQIPDAAPIHSNDPSFRQGVSQRRSSIRAVGIQTQRTRFQRWRSAIPSEGAWFQILWPENSEDPLEQAERNKERVRLLLARYGILFRGLFQRELPHFGWARLFRTLRLMELSGEILGGYFFHGIPGPQFISHHALRMARKALPERAVWWVHAADPASLCGIPVDSIKAGLPRRKAGTHIVYQGKEIRMISRGKGRRLTILCDPGDPDLPLFFWPFSSPFATKGATDAKGHH